MHDSPGRRSQEVRLRLILSAAALAWMLGLWLLDGGFSLKPPDVRYPILLPLASPIICLMLVRARHAFRVSCIVISTTLAILGVALPGLFWPPAMLLLAAAISPFNPERG